MSPQLCFLNSAVLRTQPLRTSRCGELMSALLPQSTCGIAAGMCKDVLYRSDAFPCLGGRVGGVSFTGLFFTHCPHLSNLWSLLFWDTALIRQPADISHDAEHHQQQSAGLLTVSLPSVSSATNFVCPPRGQLCSREIALPRYLRACICFPVLPLLTSG